MFDQIHILACPLCKTTLQAVNETNELYCSACGLAFPVKDKIPILLVDEARADPD